MCWIEGVERVCETGGLRNMGWSFMVAWKGSQRGEFGGRGYGW